MIGHLPYHPTKSASAPKPSITFSAHCASETQLPQGAWLLEVTEGALWILCNGDDHFIHSGCYIELNVTDENACVRNLHHAVSVAYTLTPQE